MIQAVSIDILSIGIFLNGAWILPFFGPTKRTINFSN